MTPTAVVVGAGLGGLTTATLLTRAGWRVIVLEAHVYAGGCAGTFYHQGFRFDAGATLVGGFDPGGPHALLAEWLDLTWPVRRIDPAWVVHLPTGAVTQWADRAAWAEERRRVFPGTERFWTAQERLARTAWDLSARGLPWPPESFEDYLDLALSIRPDLIAAAPAAFQSVASLAGSSQHDPTLRAFLDTQLLISAQVSSDRASALYGSAALDLPRRGVYHVPAGVGELAATLVTWLRRHGAEVLFRQRVSRILVRQKHAVAVRTEKGLELGADVVIANQTPWALAELLGDAAPSELRREIRSRRPTWGAFMLYLGARADALAGSGDHHQVLLDSSQPLGEGNSVFVSISNDPGRAPKGQVAITASTHTAVEPWMALARQDPEGYRQTKQHYAERMLRALTVALPGLPTARTFQRSASPATFARFTGRAAGMVGGFPQTSLWTARGPGTGIKGLWLVGDSVFPGQSTAGVTLGGMRVAGAILRCKPTRFAASTGRAQPVGRPVTLSAAGPAPDARSRRSARGGEHREPGHTESD